MSECHMHMTLNKIKICWVWQYTGLCWLHSTTRCGRAGHWSVIIVVHDLNLQVVARLIFISKPWYLSVLLSQLSIKMLYSYSCLVHSGPGVLCTYLQWHKKKEKFSHCFIYVKFFFFFEGRPRKKKCRGRGVHTRKIEIIHFLSGGGGRFKQ